MNIFGPKENNVIPNTNTQPLSNQYLPMFYSTVWKILVMLGIKLIGFPLLFIVAVCSWDVKYALIVPWTGRILKYIVDKEIF